MAEFVTPDGIWHEPASSGEFVFPGGIFHFDVTVAGYSLSCDAGSYALTGTAATLQHDKEVDAASGAYTWTGTAADLIYGRSLDAGAATYVWTGTASELQHDKSLVSEAGAYSWTGSDATLTYAPAGVFTLVADSGSYSWAGSDAGFLRTYAIEASSTAYTSTGSDVTLSYSAIPVEPYDVGYKGGGRVMRKGTFPKWWKDEEEPQPKETPDKSTDEEFDELVSRLPKKKPKSDVVVKLPTPSKRREEKTTGPKTLPGQTGKEAEEKAGAASKQEAELKTAIAELVARVQQIEKRLVRSRRMQKKLAAALVLLMRKKMSNP